MNRAQIVSKTVALLLATAASVNAAFFDGESTRLSLLVQSEDMNSMSDSGKVGTIIGFLIFGVFYLSVVGLIFHDISKRGKSYEELIEDDLNQLRQLGLAHKLNEFDAELQVRLKGKKEENAGDNMLMAQAANLSESQYRQFM